MQCTGLPNSYFPNRIGVSVGFHIGVINESADAFLRTKESVIPLVRKARGASSCCEVEMRRYTKTCIWQYWLCK